MTAPDPCSIDFKAAADAFLVAFKGGGWTVPGLIGFYIVCRFPPWRRPAPKGDA